MPDPIINPDETCKEHPYSMVRDGECIACHPMDVINLNSTALTLGVLAQIASTIERWGKVQVINAALPIHGAGYASFELGEAIGRLRESKES